MALLNNIQALQLVENFNPQPEMPAFNFNVEFIQEFTHIRGL